MIGVNQASPSATRMAYPPQSPRRQSVFSNQPWVSMGQQTTLPLILRINTMLNRSNITYPTRTPGTLCSQSETQSTLTRHFCKLLRNSQPSVGRTTTLLILICRLADASLLPFWLIWHRKLATTTLTIMIYLFSDKPCITSRRWTVRKGLLELVLAVVTINPPTGLKNSILPSVTSNTMEEDLSSFHGITTMEHFQKFLEKAPTTRRCTC